MNIKNTDTGYYTVQYQKKVLILFWSEFLSIGHFFES